MTRTQTLLMLVLASWGCGGEPMTPPLPEVWVTVDSGPLSDAATADAGRPDAALDASRLDASTQPDASAPMDAALDAGPVGETTASSRIYGEGGAHSLRGLTRVGDEMLVVGATSVVGAGGREGVFARLGRDGTPRFSRTVGSSRDDVLESVVFVGGQALASGRLDNQMATVWFDAETGEVARELHHGTGTLHRVVDVGAGRALAVGGGGYLAHAIVLDADGDVVRHQTLRVREATGQRFDMTAYDGLMIGDDIVVAGRATDSGIITRYWNAVLSRLRPDGTAAWTLLLRPYGQTAFRAVEIMGDGDLLAVGETEAGPGSSAMFVVRVRPSGEIRWARTLGLPEGTAHAYDVVVEGERAWVVGRLAGIEGSSRYSGWVVEVDDAGMVVSQQALRAEDGGLGFYEAALSSSGALLAVGYSYARSEYALGFAASVPAEGVLTCDGAVRPAFEVSTPVARSPSMADYVETEDEESVEAWSEVGPLRLPAFDVCESAS
ncbi:MAG: hypothetical protein AB8I08_19135 [Sandaracinaceae bacterium]